MPATTVQRPDGTFANNVLPYPTEIIQTEALTKVKQFWELQNSILQESEPEKKVLSSTTTACGF